MKAKQLVLLTALWLSALVFPPERALTSDYPGTGEQITPFFAAREAYAVVPFLNEPGTGRGYFATAAEEMATSSLPGGVDTESQNAPSNFRLFRPGNMEVTPNRLVSSNTVQGLWEGVIETNRQGENAYDYNQQKGNALVMAVQIFSAVKFRLKDIVYEVQSSHSQGLLAGVHDLAGVGYEIPYFLGWNWGSDNIAGTGDDVYYGTFVPNDAPVNYVTIVYFPKSVNMDAVPGSTTADRLHNAIAKFDQEFQVRVHVRVWPYDDSRSGSAWDIYGPALTIQSAQPNVKVNPSSTTVRRGRNATFTVVAKGQNLSYQWLRDDQEIASATSASYTLEHVTDADTGARFRVKVTNSFGDVVSNDAVLTVVPPPAPTAVTGGASSVSTNSAVLSGTVNPQDEQSTYWFEYARGDEPFAFLTPVQSMVASTTPQSVSASIAGLAPRQVYRFRLVASGPGGTATGEEQSFTTSRLAQPFLGYAGTYFGLIGEHGEGRLTLTVSKQGKFTAAIAYGGKQFTVRGTLSEDGNFLGDLGKSGFLVSFKFDIYGTGEVGGGITPADEGFGEFTFVKKAQFTPRNPTSRAGTYTATATPTPVVGQVPAGGASLSLRITKTGGFKLTGKLPDNTAISLGGALAEDGSIRVYIPTARGKGVVAGFVAFVAATDRDLSGELYWKKPENAKAKLYPQGFEATLAVVGSLYDPTAWAQTCPPMNLSLGDGNLPSELTRSLTCTRTGFQVQNPGSEGLRIKRNAHGLVSGDFVHPVTGKRTPFNAVLLQKDGKGGGYFLGFDRGGRVVMEAMP